MPIATAAFRTTCPQFINPHGCTTKTSHSIPERHLVLLDVALFNHSARVRKINAGIAQSIAPAGHAGTRAYIPAARSKRTVRMVFVDHPMLKLIGQALAI